MDWIDIDRLVLSDARPEGFVPRPSEGLRSSMRTHGPIDPVVVRAVDDGAFEILSNPETWQAAGELAIHQVPVVVMDDVNDDEAADIVKEQYTSRAGNPISEAESFVAQLKAHRWWKGDGSALPRGAVSRVARATGHSRPYVANALRLLQLPLSVKEDVKAKRLSVGQARPLLALTSRSDQVRLAARIKAEGLTARRVEKLVKGRDEVRTAEARAQAEAPAEKDPDLVRLEQKVGELLGAQFTIDGDKATINFYGNLDILDGILSKLGYQG